MASTPAKFLAQVAVNLLLILIFLVGLVSVIRDLLTQTGDLGENLFLLVTTAVILFFFISFLARLIRSSRSNSDS